MSDALEREMRLLLNQIDRAANDLQARAADIRDEPLTGKKVAITDQASRLVRQAVEMLDRVLDE
jgi:hypothetical protein